MLFGMTWTTLYFLLPWFEVDRHCTIPGTNECPQEWQCHRWIYSLHPPGSQLTLPCQTSTLQCRAGFPSFENMRALSLGLRKEFLDHVLKKDDKNKKYVKNNMKQKWEKWHKVDCGQTNENMLRHRLCLCGSRSLFTPWLSNPVYTHWCNTLSVCLGREGGSQCAHFAQCA